MSCSPLPSRVWPPLRVLREHESAAAGISRSPLRIGVNVLPLQLRIGGMRHYVLQLLPAIVRGSKHEFLLFHYATGIPCLRSLLAGLTTDERRRVTTIEVNYADQILAYGDQFDFYFCPLNGLEPPLLDRPTMATIADVQEQFFPQNFTEQQLADRAAVFPKTARAATTLLTISEFSRQSICRAFDVPEEKVRAVPLAPNRGLLEAKPDWPHHLAPLPERFLFYPASLYPHKNHELLLSAFKRYIESGARCSLILTGHPASPGVDIEARIAAFELQHHVRWLGHVSSGALGCLYSNAEALVFTSQFEGFGMPLVEAMHFGCPIVAVDSTCIAEVVGDAAMLVPPDEHLLCDAIRRVLIDPNLRSELVERGHEVAKRFSIERLADSTLDLIDETYDRFWNPRSGARRNVSYVVLLHRNDSLAESTILSLLDELTEHDEIIVVGQPGRIGRRLRDICDNSESIRIVAHAIPSKIIAATRNEIVHVLFAGAILCRGASATLKAAFDADPSVAAVVGDLFSHDRKGRYNGFLYLNPPADHERDMIVPLAAVSWRRVELMRLTENIGSFKQLRRPTLPIKKVRSLYRTVCSLPSRRWWSNISTAPPSVLNRVARTIQRGPMPTLQAGSRLLERVTNRARSRFG